MAATVTLAAPAGGVIAVTGTGYPASSQVILAATYAASNGKRGALAMYFGQADGAGALTGSVPVRYTGGTVIVRTVSSAGAVLATSSSQAV